MGLPHCLSLEGESLRGLFRRIEREVVTPGFASALLLDGLCLSLLVETARALRTAKARSHRKGGLSARNLRLIEDRIHLDETVPTLAQLGEMCQLSPRHLVRAFHAETGRTVGDYVQRVKLERAQHLLSDSTLPIAEIARRVGFSSPAAFSTAFRRLCGQAPSTYRMSNRTA
jgi:AraC family transcriptional regulator